MIEAHNSAKTSLKNSSRNRAHAVIYVPGLGDSRVAGQQMAVDLWRLQGVEPYLFQMNWSNGEAFAPKMTRLLKLIDGLTSEGKIVSLVGASAGGSVVMNALALRRNTLNGVACICGKISNKHNVHPLTYQRNVAFHHSMHGLDDALPELTDKDMSRVLSLHPIVDNVVPIPDTKLAGAHIGTMPTFGHFLGIAYGLTLGSFRIMRFLKKIDRSTVGGA